MKKNQSQTGWNLPDDFLKVAPCAVFEIPGAICSDP
jgi:hypothetical protein